MKLVSKKSFIVPILILVFLGLFLFKVGEVKAFVDIAIGAVGAAIGVAEGTVTTLAQGIVKWVVYSGFMFFGFLVTVFALLFQGVLDFGFISLEGVQMGWTISRDITNMFFILGLVVIAFATILRFETYGMKALLPKLIIIALLINFSFLICGAIIDASQIIANYFVNKIKGEPPSSIGLRLLDSLRLGASFDPVTGIGEAAFRSLNNIANFGRFLISVGFIILVLILTCIALIVGAILLLIRIGALWILMILAPFAWFFSIFPGLKAMSKKWWDNFLKYAFFAPIYIFFIYLIIYTSPHIFNQAQQVFAGDPNATFIKNLENIALVEMANNVNLIFGFVFVIMLLLGAPVIATSMGLHATNAVVKTYQGIKGKATALPWKGLKYAVTSGLKKFDRDVLAPRGLSPRAAIEAWKLRKAAVEEEKMTVAIGEWRDKLNLWFGEGKTFYAERARDVLRQKEQELIRKQSLSLEGVADIANESAKAVKAGQLHLVPRFQAAYMELVDRADEEGIMLHDELGRKYGNLTDVKNYQQLIKDIIPNEDEAIRFAGQIGALAKQRGVHYLDGMSKYDPNQRKQVWTPEDELGAKAALELAKLSPRYIYQYSNRRNFATMDINGNAVAPSRLLEKFLARTTFDDAHLNDLGRYMAPETVLYLKPIIGKLEKIVDKIKAVNPTAETWLKTLKDKVAGVSP